MTPDPAAEFRQMCLAHCAACRQAGIPEPTPDEWTDQLERFIAERSNESDAE